MVTTLPTLRSRLGILETDIQYDALLTNAIKAVSARFDKETQAFPRRHQLHLAMCHLPRAICRRPIRRHLT